MKGNTYKSTCCYCGVGCGVLIHDLGKGQVKVTGDTDHPVNKGMLCSKGINLQYTVNDKSDRLLYPQMRYNRSMPLERVSWNEALDRASAIFKTFIENFGPESVGFYVSGQCLTEEYYLWNKLMKGFIGANNIDTNSRLCMSSAVAAYNMSLGEDLVPVCYDDIELSDVILIEGANPAWCHPILWRRIEAHKEKNPDVKIIVLDPRKTPSALGADLHIDLLPGTDVAFNYAISRYLIENEYINHDFILDFTEGFQVFSEKVMEKTIEEYAEICKIETSLIIKAATWIGQAKGFLSMWTMGLNQSVIGVNKNLSLINLHLITGKIGKPGSGPFSLTGQPNAMGGREVGGLSTMLASHRTLSNESQRAEIQTFWNSKEISPTPGLTATEMFDALATGKMKAIWIVCTNPMVSLPNSNLIEKALKEAKFVIVQDISNQADTLKYADLILPAAAWAEKTGTMTNAERRISLLEKAIDPPGEAKPDYEIICEFAKKMGWGGAFNYTDTSQVYNEYKNTTAGTNIDISKLNYEVLKTKTVQWPYLNTVSTPRLFTENSFSTISKKAKIHAPNFQNLSEPLSHEFPLILLTGRIRDQWHTMTKTKKVKKLNQHIKAPFLEINPKDAADRNILNDQVVTINSARGHCQVKAKISENIKQGSVFLPMHWGFISLNSQARVNNLTPTTVDPISKEPDFKFSAVEIKPYIKPRERILIIGAGAAACGFINAYRKLNTTDEILVFSKEDNPFYNRIMLPDYVAGVQTWQQLLKLTEDELTDLFIKVYKGIEIIKIDTKNKIIYDKNLREYRYDKLIIATGSQAFVPKNFPKMKGVFSMRNKRDADGLMNLNKQNVVIVGGGLLGLEMAASLNDLGLNITVVQRISRLMDRQLDQLGSDILHNEIINRGIDIYYNDEVEQFFGEENIKSIRLKSGVNIKCEALIVATGTVAQVQIAKDANILTNRGIVVNNYLQTSDPSVFACGEIAEFQQQMWGISSAAEQQAESLAAFMAGDITQPYAGSLSMNILKIDGLELCSLGTINIPEKSEGYEEVIFVDKSKHYYKKCVILNDRLVGAILIGDKSEFIEFKDLISKGIELSEKRLQLLRSGKKPEKILGNLVCSCNSVGEGNIILANQNGSNTLKSICETTGAGMGCGSCKPEINRILKKTLELINV